MTFTVTLSAAYDQAVTVRYATGDGSATVAGGDYVATSGTLTFAAGQTTRTFTVTIRGDKKREADEYFDVVLSGASSNALHLVRVRDGHHPQRRRRGLGRAQVQAEVRTGPVRPAPEETPRGGLPGTKGSAACPPMSSTHRRVRRRRGVPRRWGRPGGRRVPLHPDRRLRAPAAPARRVPAGLDLPGQQAAGRPRGRRRAVDAGAHLRSAHGPGRRRPPPRAGHPRPHLDPAQRPGHRPADRAGGAARRLLRAPLLPRHRRHRRPRPGLGGRRAVGGQHPLLVPLHPAPRLQLRAPLAAAVRHRPGRRGPLPPQRPGHGGRPAAVRHGPGRDRHRRGLAGRASRPGAA